MNIIPDMFNKTSLKAKIDFLNGKTHLPAVSGLHFLNK